VTSTGRRSELCDAPSAASESNEQAGEQVASQRSADLSSAPEQRFAPAFSAGMDDWVITPAGLPLEPMVVIDARGNEVGSQLKYAVALGSTPRAPTQGGRHHEQEKDPESSVLNVDELATLLRLNRKTVYDALSRGQIPGAIRIGGRYRILRNAVLHWLADGQGRASRSRGFR
jgi:excisionase family DNA binding protein